MNEQQKIFFIKAENLLKDGIAKLKAEGNSELASATLAHAALNNLFTKKELGHAFYQNVLDDLELIYISEPSKTFEIYRKYGICK